VKKLLVLAVLVVSACLPLPGLHLSTPVEAVTASGALSPGPLNYDFSAAPEVVSAPTNNSFDNGLTGWTIENTPTSNVSVQSGGLFGNYAQIIGGGSLNPKLYSSPFTISSSGQFLTFWTYGSTAYLYIAKDTDYNTWNFINTYGGPGWNKQVVGLSSYVGHDIKIKFAANGTVGFDEPAWRIETPNWTTSGTVSSQMIAMPAVTDATKGDNTPYCRGLATGSAGAGPSAGLDQNASVLSSAFTMPADSSLLSVQFVGKGLGPAASIQLYYGQNYGTNTVLYNRQLPQGTTAVSSLCDVSSLNLAGQNVKIKFSSSFGGTIFVRVGGLVLNAGDAGAQAQSKDPAAYHSGELSHSHTDIAIPGKGVPLEFTRYYTSSRDSVAPGAMGDRWFHNYESNLMVLTSGSVLARYPDSTNVFFSLSSGVYSAPTGVHDTLVKNADNTYTLTTTAQVKYNYDTNGRFTSIVDRDSNTTSLSYNSLGQLSSVTDPGGHQLTFTYEGGASAINTPAAPTLLFTNSDFESGNWTNWTQSGTAFGSAPSNAAVSGKQGTYFGSSYYSGGVTNDSYTGTLISQTFTAGKQLVVKLNGGTSSTVYAGLVLSDQSEVLKTSNDTNSNTFNYITIDTSAYEGQTVQLKVSDQNTGSWGHIGIDYVQIVTGVSGTYTPQQGAPVTPFFNGDFEHGSWANWFTTGTAFGARPGCGNPDPGNRQGSCWATSGANGNSPTGTLTSTPFTAGKVLTFTLTGGNYPTTAYAALVLGDGSEVLKTTGTGGGPLQTVTWDTSQYAGQTVKFRLVDNATGSNGYIGADDIRVTYYSRLTTVADPLSRTVNFTYDNATNNLLSVQDVKGGTTQYTYTSGRLATITDSLSQLQVTNTYDDAGRLVEQHDAMNGVTCFYYGLAPAYTSSNCPGVSPSPQAGMTVEVDQLGNKTTYYYDTRFRTTDVVDASSGVTHYAYDTSNNPTSVTDPSNHVTSYTYDSNGNVLTMTNGLRQPVGTAESGSQCGSAGTGNGVDDDGDGKIDDGCPSVIYTYTSKNDVDLATDARGNQTDYIYDSSGNLTRIAGKDGSGNVKALICYERDSSGLVTATVQSTDLTIPSGTTDQCTGDRTEMGYDSYGDQTCLVDARFSSTSQSCSQIATKTTYTYDAGGRQLSATSELRQPVGTAESGSQCGSSGTGNGVDDDSDGTKDDGCPSVIYTYDNQNNVLMMTDALGNVTSYTYDAKGERTKVTDANRQPVGTAESGSQCGSAGTGNGTDDDSDGTKDDGCPSQIVTYNAAGQVIATVDALGNKTTYGYDADGNKTSVTNPNRQPVGTAESGSQCGSSGTGNGVDDDSDGTKDDGCPSAKYAYDALNRLTSETDALGRVTSYAYNGDSTLQQKTDARSLVTKYFPDAAHQLGVMEFWNGSTLVSSVDYYYDDAGNRTSMVDVTGTTSYQYDALDRVTSVTSPGSSTVSYTYDDLPGGSAADYPGQRTKITYADSKTAAYTYKADGRMETVTDWLSKATTYSYDNSGQLTHTVLGNGVTTDNTYDAAGRLTNLVNKDGVGSTLSSYAYTLDKVGNRTQVADTNGTTTVGYDAGYQVTAVTYPNSDSQSFTYDAMGNRLSTTFNSSTTNYTYDAADEMTAAGATSYGYDANGNQTSRGSDTFGYDHQNRLTSTSLGGTSGSYAYNGDAERTSRTLGGSTVSYSWDQAAALPQVLQDSAGNTYVYGLDLIARTVTSGNQEYYLSDGLGSTTGLTDGSGTVVATYSYDVYGGLRSQTGSSANEFTYTAEQNDSTGLEYLRARYYDPATGRFLSEDPLPLLRRYPYAGNDPVNYVDPSGDCLIEVRLTKVEGAGLHIPYINTGYQAWHTYVYTYDPTNGSSLAYQGGPQNPGGGASRSLSDSSGSDSVGGGSGFGDLMVLAAEDSVAFSGPKKVVHEEDKESCDSWRSTFSKTAYHINDLQLDYHLSGPNSNSATRALLSAAHLSTKKPGTRRFWFDKYSIPGWDTKLP
jgi:RHS repeat-associated protein